MRIAIIGGNSDDERQLGRLVEKAGHAATFVRSRAASPAAGSASFGSLQAVAPVPGVIEHVVERLERDVPEEFVPGRRMVVRNRDVRVR